MVSLDCGFSKISSKFSASRNEGYDCNIQQTKSSVQQKSLPFSVIFLCDLTSFELAQSILAQLCGFASSYSPRPLPIASANMLIRPNEPRRPSKTLDHDCPVPPNVHLKIVKFSQHLKIQLDQAPLKSTIPGGCKGRLWGPCQGFLEWPGFYWYWPLSFTPARPLLRRRP